MKKQFNLITKNALKQEQVNLLIEIGEKRSVHQ